MVKRKKLNKNVVGSLTAGGMIVSVMVMWVITMNLAGRDPEVFASKARELEEIEGADLINLRRAADLYIRAYHKNKDSKYVIAAANCSYRGGDFTHMFKMLNEAHSLSPHDPTILEAYLKILWELRIYLPELMDQMRDRSAKLLEIDPDNVLGLVCRVESLRAATGIDPTNAALSAEALRKAIEVAPLDPRVALVRSTDVLRKADEAFSRVPASEAGALLEQARQSSLTILREAWEQSPGDTELTTELVRLLSNPPGLDEARRVLEKAVATNPADSSLHALLAQILYFVAQRDRERLTADDPEQLQALLTASARAAEEAVRLDVVRYSAYGVLADLREFGNSERGLLKPEEVTRTEQALQVYHQAFERTLNVQTLRAELALRALEPVKLVAKAFDTAADYRRRAPDAQHREAALAHCQRIVDLASTKYPTMYLTDIMVGEMALFKNELRPAIAAFARADDKMASLRATPALQVTTKEKLAELYNKVGEPGMALRFVEKAIDGYAELKRPVPIWLHAAQVELNIRFGDYQRGLDLLNSVRGLYDADNEQFRRLGALALSNLKRCDDAMKEMGEGTASDLDGLMFRARLWITCDQPGKAEPYLRKILDARPDDGDALKLYTSVMRETDKAAEATEYLTQVRDKLNDESLKRVLSTYIITLSASDTDDRDARIKEVIQQIPDAFDRNREFYFFYSTRNQLEEAQRYLDELEHAKPDEPGIVNEQFILALRREEFTRAESYAAKVTRLGLDPAATLRVRGQLKLARNDAEGAIKEFSAAIREHPTDSDLKVRLAEAYLKLPVPRVEEAAGALKDAVRFDPVNFQANKLLYAIHEQLGRREESLPYLRAAARIRPDDSFVQEHMKLLNEEEDPVAGIASREKLRSEQPDNAENLTRLAELYAKMVGRPELRPEERAKYVQKGHECIEAGRQLNGSSVSLARVAAQFYRLARRVSDGEEYLRNFLESQQDQARVQARLMLARFLFDCGERSAAQEEYVAADRQASELSDPGERDKAQVMTGMSLVDFYSRTDQLAQLIETGQRLLPHLRETAEQQEIRLRIVDAMIRQAEYAAAKEALDKYAEAYPEDVAGKVVRVQLMLATPETDPEKRGKTLFAAREILTGVLHVKGDLALARHLRGVVDLELARAHQQRQFLEEARGDLIKAKEIAPEDFNLMHRVTLARVYEELGDTNLAEIELKRLIELRPEDARMLARLVQLFERTRQPRKAQQFLGECAAREPNNPHWPHQLGRLLIEAGEFSAAVPHLITAAETYTRINRPNELIESDVLNAMVESRRAREAVDRFERLDPRFYTPRVRAHAGRAYVMVQQGDRAVQQLNKALNDALATNPGDLAVVTRQIQTLPHTEARRMYESVLRTAGSAPGGIALRLLYAQYLLQLADESSRGEARRQVETVLGQTIGDSQVRSGALVLKAQLLIMEGKPEEAIKLYEDVLRFDGNNLEVLNNLAFYLAELKKAPAEALPYAERLRELVSRAADAGEIGGLGRVHLLDTIGWVYHLNARSIQAADVLEQAVRLDPKAAEPKYHLGMVYHGLGRMGDARRQLEGARDAAREAGQHDIREKAEHAIMELR
jgi:tetratricopeptide (TPR) repeat protein